MRHNVSGAAAQASAPTNLKQSFSISLLGTTCETHSHRPLDGMKTAECESYAGSTRELMHTGSLLQCDRASMFRFGRVQPRGAYR